MKTLFTILLIGLMALPASAGMVIGSGAAGGDACTEQQSIGAIPDDAATVGNVSGYTYYAGSFTANSSYTLTQVAAHLKKSGSPTGTFTAYVYSSTGAPNYAPSSSLATSSNTVAMSSLTTTSAYYNFQFSGLSLTSGTRYHVVLKSSTIDASNYAVWSLDGGQSGDERIHGSSNGSTWTEDGATYSPTVKTYVGTCP